MQLVEDGARQGQPSPALVVPGEGTDVDHRGQAVGCRRADGPSADRGAPRRRRARTRTETPGRRLGDLGPPPPRARLAPSDRGGRRRSAPPAPASAPRPRSGASAGDPGAVRTRGSDRSSSADASKVRRGAPRRSRRRPMHPGGTRPRCPPSRRRGRPPTEAPRTTSLAPVEGDDVVGLQPVGSQRFVALARRRRLGADGGDGGGGRASTASCRRRRGAPVRPPARPR